MHKKVLITGGSGTVGHHLSNLLLQKGYEVVHLSRSEGKNPKIKTYLWDVEKHIIDENCINGVDYIVHLAGAGIADGRWTSERKNIIINSRTESIRLIYNLLKTKSHQVKAVISASASGFYSERGSEWMTEDSTPNTDFLGYCSVLWEQAVDEALNLGLRVVKFRTGVILDKDSGALPKMAAPIKLGIGSPLGNGNQFISWIHIDDVINMYLKGIEDEHLNGAYNMSTPNPITNKELTKAIAKTLKKPLWLPNVPSFILELIFGEMSSVVLGSTRMNVDKILKTGFQFKYPDINSALEEIYG
ncbi:TIGR01777 family oxidoreductase [Pelobium sp.]|nr:TIGR01777 family oxidoreductase [Pelobium sp.]MDA9555017.1 TIGR01777 family oxidoreductase [Pelobium sp.]